MEITIANPQKGRYETIDQMTTAAAIDRVVHHSVILELNIPSYRMEAAQKKIEKESKERSGN